MSHTLSRGPRHAPAVIALFLLVATACGGDAPAPEAPDSIITLGADDVAQAVSRTVEGGVPVTGSLDPIERVVLKSQVASTVERVSVDRGSRVRRGQPLVTLDARSFAATFASAEAQLAAADRDLEASDTLFKAGAVSERDFVNARAARDAAAARVTEMRQDLERTTVRAPMHGVVSARSVTEGEAVRVGDDLLTIVRTDSLEMEAKVNADTIGAVRIGQDVVLRLDAYAGRDVRGRVSRIEPVADQATRQVSVFITVSNRDGALVGGLFASGTIVTTNAKDATAPQIAIPATAVQGIGDSATVAVVAGDKIVVRTVRLGARDISGWIAVLEGLQAGDRVVVDGANAPADGTPVRVAGDPSTAGGVK